MLGDALREADRCADAIPILERTLDARRRSLGPAHRDTLASMNNLAVAYFRVGRLPDATRIHEEAFKTLTKVFGPNHPNTLFSQTNLGIAFLTANNAPMAVKHLSEASAELRKRFSAEHEAVVESAATLGAALLEVKQFDGAISNIESTLAIRARQRGAHDPEVMQQQLLLASAYRLRGGRGDVERALKLNSEVLTRMRARTPNDWRVFVAESALGETLMALAAVSTDEGTRKRHLDEAERSSLNAYEGLVKSKASAPPAVTARHLKETSDRLVKLYERQGNSKSADEWRKRHPATTATPASEPSTGVDRSKPTPSKPAKTDSGKPHP